MTCVNFNSNCMKCKSYSTDLKGLKQRKTEFTQFEILSIIKWTHELPMIFAIVTVESTLALILALDDAYGLVFYVDRVSALGKLRFGKLTRLKCVIG